MTYCFVCPNGHRTQAQNRDPLGYDCYDCGEPLRRDWQTEGVGIGEGVRESRREHTNSGYRDLFLPTADDYKSPDDPDGQKGLRDWAETHGPREDNKRPMWPEMDRKVFPTS